jgi:hypothetical protein
MVPGQNHRVELADTANGYLIADAFRIAPLAAAKTATWILEVNLADTTLAGKVAAGTIYCAQDDAPVDGFTWIPAIATAGEQGLCLVARVPEPSNQRPLPDHA